MSPPVIIAAIIICIAVLMCYAFFSQAVANKRKQRERLSQGLKTRARNFHYMLDNLPKGPLAKELLLLVQRCLIRVYEQLSQLEPDDNRHDEQIKALVSQMAETQKLPSQISHEDAVQESSGNLGDLKSCLEELNKYVHQLAQKGSMKAKQAAGYQVLIQRLLSSMTVNVSLAHAKAAEDSGNYTLAVHHMARAQTLLQKSAKDPFLTARAKQISEKMQALMNSDAYASQQAKAAPSSKPETQDEADFWKKKQVYD